MKLQKSESITAEKFTRETCRILTGEIRDSLLHAKMRWREFGSPASVEFDWQRVWDREEAKGDIVGFYHTHPPGFYEMSARDETTMRAWAFSFGKPLLCAIEVMPASRAPKLREGEFDCAPENQELSTKTGAAVASASASSEADGAGKTTIGSWLVFPSGKIVQCPRTVIFKSAWLIAVLF